MNKARSITLSSLLLVTASLLSSCGQDNAPTAASPQRLPSDFQYLHTLSVSPGISKADLEQRYGGYVVSYNAAQGKAIIATHSASLKSASLGVQDLAAEANAITYDITEQGVGVWASGVGAWASGFGTWSSGFGTWATSSLMSSASATTFSDNLPAWNAIKLSQAQALVPELGRGVKVAVIDTGIDLSHPAFAGKLDLVNAKDFLDGDARPQEVNGNATGSYSAGYGHGTAVADLVLQVAPRATILPIRVLRSNGGGDTATIITAISYAKDNGAQIINLSLGSAKYSAALDSAVKDAVNSGIAVVCASGNTGNTKVVFPAASANDATTSGAGSVSVGSVNAKFLKSSFSTYGPALELTAPGENITTAFPDGQFIKASGTSFAAPVVSGVLALALSTGINTVNASQAAAMMSNLDTTATAPSDPTYLTGLGYGTINAYDFLHKYR